MCGWEFAEMGGGRPEFDGGNWNFETIREEEGEGFVLETGGEGDG